MRVRGARRNGSPRRGARRGSALGDTAPRGSAGRGRAPRAAAVALLGAALTCAAPGGAAAQPRLPALTVEAPESLRAVAAQLGRLDIGRLAAVMQLVGLADPGNRIRVALVPEETRLARDAPPWVAAFADPDHDLIVLFPERIGSYPHDTLEVVLHHEVAHVLASRAAGGGRLPRWFNEGLASVAERSWGIGNRSRFLWATLAGGQPTVTALEGLFYEGEREAARAYVISHALVRDLLRRHGARVVARILAGVAAGAPFDLAFADATGTTVRGAARVFWRTSGGWEEWITFIASPFTLWTMIATLSLAAIWRHRRRRAERRRQWEAEERFEADGWDDPPRDYRLH